MRSAHVVAVILMVLAAGPAAGSCTPLRLGYVNQHRPPFAIGAGSFVPPAAGASVDLVREAGVSAGCSIVAVRLPPLRLRAALESGAIDAMLLDASEADTAHFALPIAKNGQLDRDRALPMYTMVYVRVQDKAAADADPAAFFATQVLGVNNGASLAGKLRAAGMRIDDGAQDTPRNLEKLVRQRIGGYAATGVSPEGIDRAVAAHYGNQVARLDKPLRIHHFWLATTRRWYAGNRDQAEAIWDWIGAHGQDRFIALVKKYEARSP
jgi:hypothetical protein